MMILVFAYPVPRATKNLVVSSIYVCLPRSGQTIWVGLFGGVGLAPVPVNRYEIREDGTVSTTVCRTGKQSLSGKWRQLAFVVSESGHLSVKYQRNHLCIHRVIYRKFKGPLREDYAVNHIDGDKLNNTPTNLELISHSANMLHCWRVLGHVPMKPRMKIDQATAEQMRAEYLAGATNCDLRQKYGLAKATVSYIINGRTWKTS